MNQNLTKTLIASNLLLLAGFIWLWRGSADAQSGGHSELTTDPKTGLSFYHKEQVKNTILKHTGDLQKCYKTFMDSKPKVESGTLKIDWQILPNGRTEKVQRVQNLLGNDEAAQALENCVIRNIENWEFPHPPIERHVYVAHSFFFGERHSGPPEMVNVKR